jgi:hypothetical protein
LLAEFNRDTKAALPPGIFRVILLPDKKSGTNTTDVTLLDPQANGGRFQFWYKPDQGGSLQVSNDQKVEFYGYPRALARIPPPALLKSRPGINPG